MSNLYASPQHLLMHGPNSSLGNHIQHVLYLFNLSQKKKLNFFLPCWSNLNDLFDIALPFQKIPHDSKCFFAEQYGGSPTEYEKKEKENNFFLRNFLICDYEFPENFWMEGWFSHADLMPDDTFFDTFVIKPEIRKIVDEKFPQIKREDNLTIHYRGTDFRNVTHGWGDMRLCLDYYRRSIEHFAQNKPLKTITIVSDEVPAILPFISNYFPRKTVVVSNATAIVDWAVLNLSSNFVSSNSSFAWTAGLFNKEMVYQPRNFLLREVEDLCFPPYIHYKNSIII